MFTMLIGGHNIDLDVIYNNFCLMATTWLTLGYHPDIYRLQGPVATCPPGEQKVKPSLTSGGTTQTPWVTLT